MMLFLFSTVCPLAEPVLVTELESYLYSSRKASIGKRSVSGVMINMSFGKKKGNRKKYLRTPELAPDS